MMWPNLLVLAGFVASAVVVWHAPRFTARWWLAPRSWRWPE